MEDGRAPHLIQRQARSIGCLHLPCDELRRPWREGVAQSARVRARVGLLPVAEVLRLVLRRVDAILRVSTSVRVADHKGVETQGAGRRARARRSAPA